MMPLVVLAAQPGWISAELLFAILSVTTFTCVGALALWAATSGRHWFIRTAVVFAILCPTLIIPSQGLFFTFLIEVLLVAIILALFGFAYRWREHRRGHGSNAIARTPRWQFSVKSALGMFTCVAVMSVIIVKMPANPYRSWWMITVVAAIAAVVTAIAAWVVHGKSKFTVRTIGAICFAAAISALGAITNHGLENQGRAIFGRLFAFFLIDENQARLFAIVTTGLFAAIIVTLLLARDTHSKHANDSSFRKQSVAALVFALWMLLIVTPPAIALAALIEPLPIVDTTLPNPNGYDEIVAIGNRLGNSAISKQLDQDDIDTSKEDAAVPQSEPELIALRKALDLPFRVPVQYDLYWDLGIGDMIPLRRVERVMNAKADAAMRAGNIDESIACRSDMLRLANSLSHSGLIVTGLRGRAIEATVAENIHGTLSKMNADQCKNALRNLDWFERNREDFENIRGRELVWMVKIHGWPSRLGYLFDKLTGEGSIEIFESFYRLNQAIMRLLEVELALRAYELEHNQLPAKLSELIPSYLAALPDDPFASKQTPLRYSISNGSCKFWSVGPDGNDDNGAPMTKGDGGSYDYQGTGDLWLGDYFGPGESNKATTENATSSPSDSETPPASKDGNGPAN